MRIAKTRYEHVQNLYSSESYLTGRGQTGCRPWAYVSIPSTHPFNYMSLLERQTIVAYCARSLDTGRHLIFRHRV